jgi:replicative DNA helicase
MTPAEHDKRQAESDAGMEQWEAERPERLRQTAEEIMECASLVSEINNAADLIQAADEIERLRAENAALRRKAEAFDVIERERLQMSQRMDGTIVVWSHEEVGAPCPVTLLERVEERQRRKGDTP